MARITLPLLIVLCIPAATGLSFNVDISTLTDYSVKDIQYEDEVDLYQDFNVSVSNIGSVGCTFRLKSEYTYNNKSFTRYSSPVPIWQGESKRIKMQILPLDYQGKVPTNISLSYCGQERLVQSFEFEMAENATTNKTVKSRTISSTNKNAKIQVEGDLLIPKDQPAYWKTSSAEITNGTANIKYDAPIFNERRSITYTVIQNETITGNTKVSLTPEPTLWEKIRDRMPSIIRKILVVSVLLNIILLLRDRKIIDWLKSIELNMP